MDINTTMVEMVNNLPIEVIHYLVVVVDIFGMVIVKVLNNKEEKTILV